MKSVSKMVMNISRTGGTESELKGAFGDLRRFLPRISEVNFISAEFQEEVDKLRKILDVSLELDSKVLAGLETLKVEFFNNRSGSFHKPMTLRPTGNFASGEINEVFEQVAKEGRSMEGGNIVMPRAESVKDIYKQYSFIKANSSAQFLKKHRPFLDDIEHKLDGIAGSLIHFMRSFWSKSCFTFLAKIQPPIAEKTDEEKGEEKNDDDIFKETFGRGRAGDD